MELQETFHILLIRTNHFHTAHCHNCAGVNRNFD